MKYLALDLETTGLYAESDHIIEVGAVVFDLEKTFKEYTAVVHTDKEIPDFIYALTNISPEEISNGISCDEMINELETMLDGVDCIVGHNVQFDIAFLKYAGLHITLPIIDTYSLATLLLPNEQTYSLTGLTKKYELGTDVETHHRALTDTVASVNLFKFVYDKIRTIDKNVLQEILKISENYSWKGIELFSLAEKSESLPSEALPSQQVFEFSEDTNSKTGLCVYPDDFVNDNLFFQPPYNYICHRDANEQFSKPESEFGERLAIQYMLRGKPSLRSALNSEIQGRKFEKMITVDPQTCTAEQCSFKDRCEYYNKLQGDIHDIQRGAFFYIQEKVTEHSEVRWKEAETLTDSLFRASLKKTTLEKWDITLEMIKYYLVDDKIIVNIENQLAILYARLGIFMEHQVGEETLLLFSQVSEMPYELKQCIETINILVKSLPGNMKTEYKDAVQVILSRVFTLNQSLQDFKDGNLEEAFIEKFFDTISYGYIDEIDLPYNNTYEIPIPLKQNELEYISNSIPDGAFEVDTAYKSIPLSVPNNMPAISDTAEFMNGVKSALRIAKQKQMIVLIVSGQKVLEDVYAIFKKELNKDFELFALPINVKKRNVKEFLDNSKKRKLLLTTVQNGVPRDVHPDLLIVTRLPFEHMGNHWFKYRSANLSNSFMQYALPRAVITMARWMHEISDDGEVWCFDRRIITQEYGKEFSKYVESIREFDV